MERVPCPARVHRAVHEGRQLKGAPQVKHGRLQRGHPCCKCKEVEAEGPGERVHVREADADEVRLGEEAERVACAAKHCGEELAGAHGEEDSASKAVVTKELEQEEQDAREDGDEEEGVKEVVRDEREEGETGLHVPLQEGGGHMHTHAHAQAI